MLPPKKKKKSALCPSSHLTIQFLRKENHAFQLSGGAQASLVSECCNPTFHTRRIPGPLMFFSSHCWVAKEMVCGQRSYNYPWQVIIAICHPESQRRISSLLFIVTAGVSHSFVVVIFFFKQQEVVIIWFWLSFFSLFFSVATLLKAPEKQFVFILSYKSASSGLWLLR